MCVFYIILTMDMQLKETCHCMLKLPPFITLDHLFQVFYRLFIDLWKCLNMCFVHEQWMQQESSGGARAPLGNWVLWFCWLFEGISPGLSWVLWAWVTIWGSKQVIDLHMIAVLDPASCLDEKYFGFSGFVFSVVGSYPICSFSPFLVCSPLQ